MDSSRPPLFGRLLNALPQPASPWQDADALPGSRPVVLVHGTVGSRNNFENIVPLLRDSGRPVVSVSYGHRGTADIRSSLDEVTEQVAAVIRTSGTVDLVGHSQGGLLSLAAAGRLDDAVGHVVGLAADFRGVGRPWFRPRESALLRRIDRALSPSFADQLAGSPALHEVLQYTTETDVPVTQIITRGDRIVPGSRTRALTSHDPLTGVAAHRGPVRITRIQDHYPGARVSHPVIPYHRCVGELIVDALADPPQVSDPRCPGPDGG